ncbi:hypothetical protein MPTK1_6g09350 [Marchantia polymorpha subsp. ruderalis]|uniref:Stress-response A/B barrel domain-containing protein n=2 Tax=Marchantia polymorpha TaxID=3197 RepID=A0AAF6BQ74_MARPO|nr:hypothetical protein MARPO_0152s0021 [Marchantia polymorpha]BBN14158.1 hypothetical protein Mp_6g09350 [Marchantia polymorpha subsp. ruderalis]|eukprot:PTQ28906.1 hypothetical protein MARPO_0152s0021 [Marchantia polymorpha]
MHVSKRPSVVEHLVLAKLNEGMSVEDWDDLLEKIHLIRSLDGVVSLHVGLAIPLVGETYTFALHARFVDMAALEAYEAHEYYVEGIMTSNVNDDLLILNWEGQPQGSLVASDTYRAAHVGVLKFKECATEENIEEALSTIKRLQKIFPELVTQVSAGRAFVPADLGDSNGFEVAFIVACPTIRACEELDVESENTDLNKSSSTGCDSSLLEDIHVVKFRV